jgi:hypothetical protein
MAKQLSDRQKDVIWKMQHGWQLGFEGYAYSSGAPIYRLQKGGLGSGGENDHVTSATIRSLASLALIDKTDDVAGCCQLYRLTSAGQKVNAA